MIEYFEIWWCILTFFDRLVFFIFISLLCSLFFLCFYFFYLVAFWYFCFLVFVRSSVIAIFWFFFIIFFIFLLLFASSLLASHCWEGIALSFPLMCFTSFFKFSISSFGEKLTLFSLVFVFFLNFLWFLFTLLFCPPLEPWFTLTCSSLLVSVCSYVVYPLYIFISSKAAFASSAVM